MKKTNYTILFFALIAIFSLLTYSLSFDPKTGDEKLDEKLSDINLSASLNINKFISRVASTYIVDETMVNEMLKTMEPADVLLTLQIGKVTDFSVYEIMSIYKNKSNNGWSSIFQELGIKNTSYEFTELKKIATFNEKSFVNSSLSQK